MTGSHSGDGRRPAGKWRALLLTAVLALGPGIAAAQYRLQPGDVLDVLVVGIPDFRQHVSIGLDGDIGLPLGGQIKLGGLSLGEARERVAKELGNKLYRQYVADGHEISHLILGSEVVVEVSDYSPLYVNGDISKPGVYPYRPGMTVRQAVAVAGGVNPVRLPGTDPAMQAAQLQAQSDTLLAEYSGQQALAWRLKAELGGGGGTGSDKAPPIATGVGETFLKGEQAQMAARKADRDSRKDLLRKAINKAAMQLAILAEKKSQDIAGNQADEADFKTVRDLFQKGLAPSTRLSEARRSVLLSSQQLLQTVSETANVERLRDEYVRQLEQIDSLGRVDGLLELQKANLRMAEIRATLKGLGDSLALVGHLQNHTDQRVTLRVYRKGPSGTQRIAADEDLALVPGDVVEAILPRDTEPGLIASSAASSAAVR
jgi:polysaccharide biosynthesis/export protein